MKTTPKCALYLAAFTLLVFSTSCEVVPNQDSELSESLETIEEVTSIEGAEQSTLIVEKGSESYFDLEFQLFY